MWYNRGRKVGGNGKIKQQTLSDTEYGFRKKKTKREEFLEIMDEIIPWDEWISVIRPYYPTEERGRPPVELELIPITDKTL